MKKAWLCTALCLMAVLVGSMVPCAAEILFEDHFTKGNLAHWYINKDMVSQWKVEQSALGSYVVGTGVAVMNTGSPIIWADYSLNAKVQIVSGSFQIGFRASEQGKYYIGYNTERKEIYLQKNKPLNIEAVLSRAPITLKSDEWYSIETIVFGNTIKTYINGKSVIEYTDKDPLTSGSIQLVSLEESTIKFSDILVKNLAR